MNAKDILLQRIARDGGIEGDVIKVDRFLNHQVDPALIEILATDLAGRLSHHQATKVLTVETSGIMLALSVAKILGIPFIYAKKKRPLTMTSYYAAAGYSFTKQESTTIYVSQEVLNDQDRLIFIDDFFARGSTLKTVEEIISQAGAQLLASAVIINKSERRDIESILTLKDLQAL